MAGVPAREAAAFYVAALDANAIAAVVPRARLYAAAALYKFAFSAKEAVSEISFCSEVCYVSLKSDAEKVWAA